MKKKEIAMQSRCVHCLKEQYAMNVIGVSNGTAPCCWCGKMSKKMTDQEWRDALHKKREERDGV